MFTITYDRVRSVVRLNQKHKIDLYLELKNIDMSKLKEFIAAIENDIEEYCFMESYGPDDKLGDGLWIGVSGGRCTISYNFFSSADQIEINCISMNVKVNNFEMVHALKTVLVPLLE